MYYYIVRVNVTHNNNAEGVRSFHSSKRGSSLHCHLEKRCYYRRIRAVSGESKAFANSCRHVSCFCIRYTYLPLCAICHLLNLNVPTIVHCNLQSAVFNVQCAMCNAKCEFTLLGQCQLYKVSRYCIK